MNTTRQYKGVEIIESCGYFYPAFNTNFESKDVEVVKREIDRVKEVLSLLNQNQLIALNLIS